MGTLDAPLDLEGHPSAETASSYYVAFSVRTSPDRRWAGPVLDPSCAGGASSIRTGCQGAARKRRSDGRPGRPGVRSASGGRRGRTAPPGRVARSGRAVGVRRAHHRALQGTARDRLLRRDPPPRERQTGRRVGARRRCARHGRDGAGRVVSVRNVLQDGIPGQDHDWSARTLSTLDASNRRIHHANRGPCLHTPLPLAKHASRGTRGVPARTKDNRLIFLRRSLKPRHGGSSRDPLLCCYRRSAWLRPHR